jgi:hypothetical protein
VPSELSLQSIKTHVKLKLVKGLSFRKSAELLEQIAFVPAARWAHFTDPTPTETTEPLERVFEMSPVACFPNRDPRVRLAIQNQVIN